MSNGKDMYGLKAALEAKGISAEKKDWKCVRITHGDPEHKTIDIDGQTYTSPRTQETVRVCRLVVPFSLYMLNLSQVTGALFQYAINAQDGGESLSCVQDAEGVNEITALVIAKQYSAAHQSQYRRPPVQAQEFPDLRSSSDITWLAWKPYHDKGAKLNHIITWSATNGATQRLMAAALERTSDKHLEDADKVLKPYPWVGWTADKSSGPLILGKPIENVEGWRRPNDISGSPNGVGIGYMLVQHKPELGRRRVRTIEAFLADTAASNLREPSIAWTVEDAPENF